MPSIGGLLVFLGITALRRYALASDHDPRLLWEFQVGQPADLNLHFNRPTVFPQGQSGHAHKAVARPLGASRFCVLRVRPHARDRPQAPS